MIDEVTRGAQAQSLLDSEIYREAVSSVHDAIIAKWESCPIRDVEGQHELKLMLKLLADLEQNIKEVVNTGKLKRLQIERDRGVLRRAVGF